MQHKKYTFTLPADLRVELDSISHSRGTNCAALARIALYRLVSNMPDDLDEEIEQAKWYRATARKLNKQLTG